WDAEHGPVSARAFEFSERIEYLRALCREYGKPRVLDLGCGTGRTLAHLASGIAAGIGVDISPVMISCARRSAARAPLHFQIGDEWSSRSQPQLLFAGLFASAASSSLCAGALSRRGIKAPRLLRHGARSLRMVVS